ncbi:putative metallopeptidase [Pusillimonas sp. NJUB218]|uniref:putative metallopeptidase n=1 Tax=unclassified Pusillimonas TaxID=2640016 RepID=UPI003512EF6C
MTTRRSHLSEHLLESLYTTLPPAPDLADWVKVTILADDGPLHNPDHAHLIEADFCFLWALGAFNEQGRTVVGQAEQVLSRAGGRAKSPPANQASRALCSCSAGSSLLPSH